MPRSRYEELQLEIVKLLIQTYYLKDPQKFAFLIRKAVLAEFQQTIEENTALRRTTLPCLLFKFGVMVYSRESFVQLFAAPLGIDEVMFLNSLKSGGALSDPSYESSINIRALARAIRGTKEEEGEAGKIGAYDLYKGPITPEDFQVKFGVSLKDVAIEVTEQYPPEMCAQINADLKSALDALNLDQQKAINFGKKRVTLTIDGKEYTLVEHKTKAANESTHLLKNEDGEESSQCCKHCCNMM